MGNFCCCFGIDGRSNIPPAKEAYPLRPTTELPANPKPNPNPNPNPNQCPGYYPPPLGPIMAAYDHHHHFHHYPPNINQLSDPLFPGSRYPMPPPSYVEHQKATMIHNHLNLRKETLRLEPDPESPNRLLVSFTFDASFSGRITVVFFAKEEEACKLKATKEDTLPPITFEFDQGLGQKFKQASGTGIDLTELFKKVDINVFPLAIRAESEKGKSNVHITQVMFTKEKGEIKIQVVKQILLFNGIIYELQEIFGLGDMVDGSYEGKQCVVCLSQPRDTTLLPCRHWCLCSGCAKVLRFQTNLCPVCRKPVERFLEMEMNKFS